MSKKLTSLLLVGLFLVLLGFEPGQARSTDLLQRSESVDTVLEPKEDTSSPGWVRRKLISFGEIASKVGNGLGSTGIKAAGYVDKLCQILKSIIPIVAAVCHVRQFQFCGSPDAPMDLADAINSKPIDLNTPD